MTRKGDLIELEETRWTFKQMILMLTFVGVLSGMPYLIMRCLGYFITGDRFYL